jgi:hypothetical protein
MVMTATMLGLAVGVGGCAGVSEHATGTQPVVLQTHLTSELGSDQALNGGSSICRSGPMGPFAVISAMAVIWCGPTDSRLTA